MRYLDAAASTALAVVLVLVVPMEGRSVGAQLGAFAAIVTGAPTVVCLLRLVADRSRQQAPRGPSPPGA